MKSLETCLLQDQHAPTATRVEQKTPACLERAGRREIRASLYLPLLTAGISTCTNCPTPIQESYGNISTTDLQSRFVTNRTRLRIDTECASNTAAATARQRVPCRSLGKPRPVNASFIMSQAYVNSGQYGERRLLSEPPAWDVELPAAAAASDPPPFREQVAHTSRNAKHAPVQ